MPLFQLGIHLRGSRCDITSVSPAFERSHCLLQKYSSPSDSLGSPGKVPVEVLDSDCPDPVLKESLIRAFHSLTERYQQRCQSLLEQLESADRQARELQDFLKSQHKDGVKVKRFISYKQRLYILKCIYHPFLSFINLVCTSDQSHSLKLCCIGK